MATTPESLLPEAGDPVREADAEPRETGGVTTRLILHYVEREGGRPAVDELLRTCGLEDEDARLRDENQWFSYEKKIRMLHAAAEVLHDPLPARHGGDRCVYELGWQRGAGGVRTAIGSVVFATAAVAGTLALAPNLLPEAIAAAAAGTGCAGARELRFRRHRLRLLERRA